MLGWRGIVSIEQLDVVTDPRVRVLYTTLPVRFGFSSDHTLLELRFRNLIVFSPVRIEMRVVDTQGRLGGVASIWSTDVTASFPVPMALSASTDAPLTTTDADAERADRRRTSRATGASG